MNRMRSALLASAESARAVLAAPDVGARWREPSALQGLSVAGLTGHLLRGLGAVEAYLDRSLPDVAPVAAAEYFARILGAEELDSPMHSNIRAKGEQAGAVDHDALLGQFDAQCEALRKRLGEEPPDRRVRAFQDIVLTLDDFLVTRIIEVVVHADDLAASVGVDEPRFAPEITSVAIEAMVAIARLRHGDLAEVVS